MSSYFYIDHIRHLTAANLKTRYRNTWAGLMWVALNPILQFGTQALVFNFILKLQIQNYLLFLVTGLLPWTFIFQSLDMNSMTIVNNARTLKSIPVSPLLFVISQTLDNLINFGVAFAVVAIPILYYFKINFLMVLIMLIPLASLAIGVTALSFLFSILQTFYQDTRFVLTFSLGLIFYLTPIFYSENLVPMEFRWALYLNPFYLWISPFQNLFTEQLSILFWQKLAFSCLTSAAMVIFVGLYWRMRKGDLYYKL